MFNNFASDHLVGGSRWTDWIRRRVVQIGSYRYSVLICGPTGTGKELVARAIHHHGPRNDKRFVPVNCATVSGTLFASQLFGHVKGAFTGAVHSAIGCFRAADGGTIFLDEIGDLDLDCQAKLLRVLQEKTVVPVGGVDGQPIDVRVIAATNRDLEEDVRQGRFRLDLFYRLNILSITTPTLKDRVEDIEPLAKHFLAKAAVENGLPLKRLSPMALSLLQSYRWPGNVRELQNMIERAMVFSEEDVIGPEAFQEIEVTEFGEEPVSFERFEGDGPVDMPRPETTGAALEGVANEWPTLAVIEKEHIEKTLHETFYNQSAAARLLGIDRKVLARKMKKYGLQVPDSVRPAKVSKSHV